MDCLRGYRKTRETLGMSVSWYVSWINNNNTIIITRLQADWDYQINVLCVGRYRMRSVECPSCEISCSFSCVSVFCARRINRNRQRVAHMWVIWVIGNALIVTPEWTGGLLSMHQLTHVDVITLGHRHIATCTTYCIAVVGPSVCPLCSSIPC